jgi:hypothetical protein
LSRANAQTGNVGLFHSTYFLWRPGRPPFVHINNKGGDRMRFIEKRQIGQVNDCPLKCVRMFYIMPVD